MRDVDKIRVITAIAIILALILLVPNPIVPYYNMLFFEEDGDTMMLYISAFGNGYTEYFPEDVALPSMYYQNTFGNLFVLSGIALIGGLVLLITSLVSGYHLKFKLERVKRLVRRTGYIGSILLLLSPMLFFLLLNIKLAIEPENVHVLSYGGPSTAEGIEWGLINYFFGFKEINSTGYTPIHIGDLYWFCGSGFYVMIVSSILGFAGTTTMAKHLDKAMQYVQSIVPRRNP